MSHDPPLHAGSDGGRRPPHTIALAVTVVLGTVLLLVGLDWWGRRGAESLLARTLQERTGVLDRPTVQVHGSPFLTQMLRGRYERVEIDIGEVSSGPLRLEGLSAELSGVYLALPDLLDGHPVRVVVERSVENAFLTYEDLDRYLRFTGRTLDVEPGPDGQVLVTGSVDVLGRTLEVSTLASLEAEDGTLLLRPTRLETAEPLDGVGELLVIQRFTFRVPLDPLPFAQRVSDIRVQPSGLAIQATGSSVVVGY